MKAMFGLLRRRRLAVVTVAIFAVAGGIAYGSIPDAGGVYHACITRSGTIRVIDPDTDQCKPNESPITFNQTGDPGKSPTVATVAAGAQCPAGGAAITDTAGTTAYVCSGQNGADGKNGAYGKNGADGRNGADGKDGAPGTPFSGTFTSPNGQYSISVTDTGVTISKLGGSVITLAGTDITVRSSGTAAVSSAGLLALNGSQLTLNATGPTCLLAARLGDSILATSANMGGTSTGFITSGSSTVCIGG